MPLFGKCPKCEQFVTHVDVSKVDTDAVVHGAAMEGLAFLCPNCLTVLGVGTDPVMLAEHVVDQVIAALRVTR